MIFSKQVNDLFSSQLNEWDLARINYGQLERVKTKKLKYGSFDILVQFNPERIRSSAAKTDTKSIEARPCFLCSENRPSQQSGVTFEKDLTFLVNPFPIFPKHLTIPSEQHTPQRILKNFGKMLNLAGAIPDFVVFYNGPECGASAPDHFHFQAGNRGFLPIESDFSGRKFTELMATKQGIEIWRWSGYMRGIITLKGSDRDKLETVFNQFYNIFSASQPGRPEPLLNILAYSENSDLVIHIIPRKLHRPTQFFRDDAEQILLSPASVDMGGVMILPREEDFNKIVESDVADILAQVCIDENNITGFLKELL
jgi:galactose-1-phosphate uridylyltransferase